MSGVVPINLPVKILIADVSAEEGTQLYFHGCIAFTFPNKLYACVQYVPTGCVKQYSLFDWGETISRQLQESNLGVQWVCIFRWALVGIMFVSWALIVECLPGAIIAKDSSVMEIWCLEINPQRSREWKERTLWRKYIRYLTQAEQCHKCNYLPLTNMDAQILFVTFLNRHAVPVAVIVSRCCWQTTVSWCHLVMATTVAWDTVIGRAFPAQS